MILTRNESGKVAVTLTIDRATARKLKLKRPTSGTVKVGKRTKTVRRGESTIVVKFTAKARAAMKTARKVKLLITAVLTDRAGNSATETTKVTLKR